jgi:hypothetical protein
MSLSVRHFLALAMRHQSNQVSVAGSAQAVGDDLMPVASKSGLDTTSVSCPFGLEHQPLAEEILAVHGGEGVNA